MTNTITGRVVDTRRTGSTASGNPIMRITIDESPDEPGAYGIERLPDFHTYGALKCYTCKRAWAEDITPAGRCPWEHEHGTWAEYRITADAGIVYGIENADYRDKRHVFELTRAGRISRDLGLAQ